LALPSEKNFQVLIAGQRIAVVEEKLVRKAITITTNCTDSMLFSGHIFLKYNLEKEQ
jgi:hypothetical protein